MRKVIEGVTYNTDTAEYLCSLPCDTEYVTDIHYHDTSLYMTRKGQFFLAGEGGPRTMWAKSLGSGNTTGGEGIIPCTAVEAREYLEQAQETDILERLWPGLYGDDDPQDPDVIEDEVRTTLRLSAPVKAQAAELAARQGVSLNAFINKAIKAAMAQDGAA